MGSTESKVAPSQPIGKAVTKEKGDPAEAGGKSVGKEPKDKKVERPNDYELAIKSCKELEFILETEFGSTGSTLHEMITNANASLPIELIMNMRYVATIGNNLVHEKSFSYIPDQAEFIKRFQRSVNALQEISKQRRIVERRVVDARRKKREAEIQEELLQEDKEWLDKQHKEITAQKARRLELEKEREALLQQKRELEMQARSRMCVCF
jgi:hypothetical protein